MSARSDRPSDRATRQVVGRFLPHRWLAPKGMDSESKQDFDAVTSGDRHLGMTIVGHLLGEGRGGDGAEDACQNPHVDR